MGGGGGGADKKFTRKGTVSTKRVLTRRAFREFEEDDGEESRNTRHEEIGKECNEE